MAAYAALLSLFNDLELIPNHPTHSFSFDNKQLSSLSRTVEFLIDFMETYDSHACTTEAAEALESRIASAAHAAHDVIESHLVDQIHAGSTLVGGRTGSYFLPDLQRAIEGVEFVRTETMQFQAKSGLKAEKPKYSSAPSTSSTEPLLTGKNKKNAIVGFDSVLLRLLDILTGEPSDQRSVVPIVGMGGIGGAEEDCPVELEEIGKKIVRRCRGLPLSIVVIGGHLRKSPRAIEYWERLSTSINPISSLGRDDQCLEILRLSYQHLPACLKSCFLYFGVYPEDHRIYVSELISYWVGEGFIKPKRGLILEEVAENYLEDLIDRNLVLVRERRWNGKAEVCGIHDVVRELGVKVATKEKFIGVVEDTTQAKGCKERRIVVQLPDDNELSSVSLKSHLLLRSIVCQRGRLLNESPVDFRLLRVSANVDMDKWKEVIHCPTPSFQRVNLRYLYFSVPYAKLPYCIHSSISLLWNLQTLTVRSGLGDGDVISAPYEIWEMPQLRHLQFDLLHLPDPHSSDGSKQEECIILRNLYTLLKVVDLKLTEEVCKRIPNIKRLGLSYWTFLAGDCEEASSAYYCLHNLGRLSKLESLECRFGQDSKWRDVIESFTFPSSLVELSIGGCHWEDLTKMIKPIPQLRYLYLGSISGSDWDLVEEEEFPHLRILKINCSHGLIHWNASSYNFPVLEELHIYSYGESSKLREIPFDLGEIPTLRLIYLMGCSASCALSAMRIVAEQENLGNEDLQLRVHFDRMEEVERFQKMVGEEGLISNSQCVPLGLVRLRPSSRPSMHRFHLYQTFLVATFISFMFCFHIH